MEGLSVTYETVATPEETMVGHRAALTPPVPSEYTPVSDYRAVRARPDYSGPVTVELAYDPAAVAAADGRTEQLRTLHLSPITGRWEDVTESVDASSEVVIGQVSDLSWFVVSLSPYAVVSDFAGAPTGGPVPLMVDFTDQSLASPTSWLWDFGDGETSSAQNPSHEYQTPGRYAVSLTATNAISSDGEAKPRYVTVRFTDVEEDTWGYAEIMSCTDAGIVSGYGDGAYNPGWAVARDQMAAYIARAVCTPMGEAGLAGYTPPATPSFIDVPTDYWTYKHIEYVAEQNIVEGYDDSTYHPTDVLDRAQMAVFIARSIVTPTGEEGLVGYLPPATPTFEDVPDTGYGTDGTLPFWAYRHIEYIAGEGIAGGYGDGLYHPEIICSRDQMAVYIFRAFELPL
jgi:PKD repeat protein